VGIDLGAQGRKNLRQVLHFAQDDEAVARTGQEDLGRKMNLGRRRCHAPRTCTVVCAERC